MMDDRVCEESASLVMRRRERVISASVLQMTHLQVEDAAPGGQSAHSSSSRAGNLISLKASSLRNCPLTSPPRDVLDRGLPNILHYLQRSQLGEGENNLRASSESEKLRLRLARVWTCVRRTERKSWTALRSPGEIRPESRGKIWKISFTPFPSSLR